MQNGYRLFSVTESRRPRAIITVFPFCFRTRPRFPLCHDGVVQVPAEVVRDAPVRGDGGTDAVPVLPVQRDVIEHEHELAVAQGVRSGRDDCARPVGRRVALPAGARRAARRVVRERVEAPRPGGADGGVCHVRGPVERQPRPPAPAAHVRAGFRADAVRHAQRALLRGVDRAAANRRPRPVRRRVADRFLPLFLYRHVCVPVGHYRRYEPHHAHRFRVRRPAAVSHRWRPVCRLPERPSRVCRRVRRLHRRQRAGPVPGPVARVRHRGLVCVPTAANT